MFQDISIFSLRSSIDSLIYVVSGVVLLSLHSYLMMSILLLSNVQPSLSDKMPTVKRNGRPIEVSSTKESDQENYFNVHDIIYSYIPSFGSKILIDSVYIVNELCTTFVTITSILSRTTSQIMIKIKDKIVHSYFDLLHFASSWSILPIIAVVFVMFLMFWLITLLIKKKIRAALQKFHCSVMEEVNNVKRDTKILADSIKESNEKIDQIMLTHHADNEKAYFEDPMLILKGIADSVRLALGENIKCILKKKRNSIKYCKPSRKAKRDRGKPIHCVRKPVDEKTSLCAKSNDSLSTIEATYESEKFVSVRDKISQIYKRSRKLSIPTYCVSSFSLPQRVWIGGKWYLEDKNNLKVAYSSQNLGSNTSVRIKVDSSQNSLISETNHFTNNTRTITPGAKSGAIHSSKSASEVKAKSNNLIEKRLSHSSILNSCQRNVPYRHNITYPCLPQTNKDREDSFSKQTPVIPFYDNDSSNPPQAVQTLNSLETSPPRGSWGGGDTYVREVWSEPKEMKPLNVTYSRDDGHEGEVIKAHVSTQTESQNRNRTPKTHSQSYYPYVYTSTPKHSSSARFRPRHPTYAEEFNARYYGSYFRSWWPNYYYGLQPI